MHCVGQVKEYRGRRKYVYQKSEKASLERGRGSAWALYQAWEGFRLDIQRLRKNYK
jgi:hypothetical protein